jgi:DNA-binding transcriptional ArsR family regulator
MYNRSMKTLVHPAVEDISLESVFYALGDKSRLCILRNLANSHDPLICIDAVKGVEELSPSTRSHHFRVLREAGLIRSEKRGKECYNTLRMEELESKFPGVLPAALKHI